MTYSYLLTILRRHSKLFRLMLLIVLFISAVTFISNDPQETIMSFTYENSSHDLINDRLRSHARFFNASFSSCDTTETLTLGQEQHFDKIAQALAQFRQQPIPIYSDDHFDGQGIVLTVGRKQIYLSQVNLKMIEHTTTRLPVQIWYSSSELSNDTVYELLHSAPKLQLSACSFTTAECRTINKTWNLNSSYVFPPSDKRGTSKKYFPSKPAAILSATFAEVLFLDADSYVVRDPEYLFQSDPMYLRFGALFFPDALMSGQLLTVWKLLNTTCGRDEFEMDSGALLVNKKRVWNPLYIAKLMNDQYELFYKLFSGGDKDTFRLAFRFLDVKYYMVGILCSTGRYNGTHFCGFTMCKTDSLGRYIFINHMSLMKYVKAGYSTYQLNYTRIGLGDPYNHSFYMQFCPFGYAYSCLFLGTQVDKSKPLNKCVNRAINQNEIEHHVYGFDEPLMSGHLKNSRMLISETNNLMPGFIDALFRYRQQVYGYLWAKSLEH